MAVLVVSWNTRDLTLRCLRSLQASLGARAAHIVVVDNGSTDGSADAVAEHHPEVDVVRCDENRGFAAGVNLGLRRVAAEYIVLVNSDAVVQPGAVQHLVDELARHPAVGVTGGRQVDPDGRFVPTGHRFPSWRHDLATAPGLHQVGRMVLRRDGLLARLVFVSEPRDVDWLSGAFIAFRRSVLDGVGPFPEEFFVYGEDIEWCWRVRRHGWRIRYVGGPGIVHHEGASSGELPGEDRPLRILDALHVYALRHRNAVGWRSGWLARWAFLRLRIGLRRAAAIAGRAGESDTDVLAACADRCLDQLLGRHGPGRHGPSAAT